MPHSEWRTPDGRVAISEGQGTPVFAYVAEQGEQWIVQPQGWTNSLVDGKTFASEDEAVAVVVKILESTRQR
jgi:hypothetical protein